MLPRFIDGMRTRGGAAQAIDVMTPATKEVLAQVPAGGADEVGLAVAAAARAFPEGALDEFFQVRHVHWDMVGAHKSYRYPYGKGGS